MKTIADHMKRIGRTARRVKANRRGVLLAAATFAATAAVLTGRPAMAAAKRAINASLNTKLAPNMLSSAQAEAILASDTDSFWKSAGDSPANPLPVLSPQVSLRPVSILHRGSPVAMENGRKELALTFDDGPHTAYTPALLDVLKRYDVPATFFVVGEMAEKAPDLVRREIAEGHEVGNHTYHHVSLVKITPEESEHEIRACDLVLRDITGKPAHLFRPPGGKYDPAVAAGATELGYTTVLWTDDPGDFASPGVDEIVDRTERTAHPGGILLLHDGISQTIDALPQIITDLRREGYTFVTVDEMIHDSRPVSNAATPELATSRSNLRKKPAPAATPAQAHRHEV